MELDRVTELAVLYEISAIPTRLTEMDQIGALVVDKAIRLLGNDVAILYLHRPETATLHPQTSRGVLLSHLTALPLISVGQAMAQAIAGKYPLSCWRGDAAAMPDLPEVLPYPVQAAICAPVRTDGELLGLIYAARLKDRPFTASERSLFSLLADRAASAIENLRLFESGQRRAMRLQTVAEIVHATTSILDLDELLNTSVDLIRERFDLYYAGIFLVDEAEKYAVLRAGTGEAGRKMLEAGHKLEVGGISMIGWCVANRQPRIALDVGIEAVRFDNPLLPETRSEMALPLVSRGEAIGAMTIQSTREAAFSEEDITVFQTMAGQLANAVENARLFTEAQARLEEVQDVQRYYLQERWAEYIRRRPAAPGYEYDLSQVIPLQERQPVEPVSVLREGGLVTQSGGDGGEGTALLAPITLGGEYIGLLGFEEPEQPRRWTPDEMALIEAVRDQLALALENRRLFEQTQAALAETETLYHASRAIAVATDKQAVLQAVVDHAISDSVDRCVLALLDPAADPASPVVELAARWARRGQEDLPPGPIRLSVTHMPMLAQIGPGDSLVIYDVATDERLDPLTRQVFQAVGIQSLIAEPLVVGERLIGWLLMEALRAPYHFEEHEVRILKALVGQMAIVIENQRLFEEAQRRARRERLIREITAKVVGSTDLDTILRTTAQELGKALGTSHAVVQLGAQPRPATPAG